MRVGVGLSFVIFGLLSFIQVESSPCGDRARLLAISSADSKRVEVLKQLLPRDEMIVRPFQVAAWTEKFEITTEQLMIDLVEVARSRARPPISEYLVGAVARGVSENLYLGVNLEFPGQAHNQTVHGEQFAVSLAFLNGEKQIESIALSAAPCGHCRQWLNETVDGKRIKVFMPNQPPISLARLLPKSFGPQDLGLKSALLAQDHGHFVIPESANKLMMTAVRAIGRSYAPYTKDRSGISLRLKNGEIFGGSYLENAGFNPGLSPLQVALVALVSANHKYDEIEEAILIERDIAKISQETVSRSLLSVIAPKARFEALRIADLDQVQK